MIIGFKPQFRPKIEAGIKIHTIRDDEHDRWQTGNLMHMATGVRTKKCKTFYIVRCTCTQWIWVYNNRVYVTLSDEKGPKYRLKNWQIKELAINDGFDTIEDFFAWFSKEPGKKRKLIHWVWSGGYNDLPF